MSFAALLGKDLRRELRGKEALQAGLVLVLTFLLLDLFTFQDLSAEPRAAALVLWTPLLYGTVAAGGRALAAEADRGTLELLRSAPVPWLWHGLSRTIASALLAGILLAVTLGAADLLFAVPVTGGLVITLAVAAVGLAIVGSLAGALAAPARARETLLPVLAVPLLVPLLQAGLSATLDLLAGVPLADLRTPLLLMAGYDLILLGAAWLLWPVVLEGP